MEEKDGCRTVSDVYDAIKSYEVQNECIKRETMW